MALTKIFSKTRARQGHSLAVDLLLIPQVPPILLYHGTVLKNLLSIKEKGLLRQNRQHVHLSKEQETAAKVGSPYGKPVVFRVEAKEMNMEGHPFYLSENWVWLTDSVPVQYFHFQLNKTGIVCTALSLF